MGKKKSAPRHNQYGGPRLTGYVSDAVMKWWSRELERVAKLESNKSLGMGTLFTRVAKVNPKLDMASLDRDGFITEPRP